MPYNNILYKKFKIGLPVWSVVLPVAAIVIYFLSGVLPGGGLVSGLLGAILIGVVLAAVHHAEVVAHKVGEPFGTLILALAITIIEVSLIVSIMLSDKSGGASTLARDTVFAAVMIILTGMIGLCLLVGGYRFKEQIFVKQGVSAALIALTAISVLSLILPNYTTSTIGPAYAGSQLIFIAAMSLVLYLGFVAVQAGRHRDYFLPEGNEAEAEDAHAAPPNKLTTVISLTTLFIALTVVVLLSKKLSPDIELIVDRAGAPKSLVGIIIALVILLPEGLAAFRAAKKNRLQTSLNLALGSALASIGLTIPAVAIVSQITGFEVILGIDAKSALLLILSLFTITISFSSGRTNILQGIVLLVLFATYLFTTIVP